MAQKVLEGKTSGYRNHPQLIRFKETNNPLGAIATYLRQVAAEAGRRGYNFDKSKILNKCIRTKLYVTDSQINYEFSHLLEKLKRRDPASYKKIRKISAISPHPLFKLHKGHVEDWEVTQG